MLDDFEENTLELVITELQQAAGGQWLYWSQTFEIFCKIIDN